MLKTILLALDGSTYSEAAVELGIRFAKRCDAMLVGLGVLDEPTIRKPEPVPLGGFYYKRHRDDTLIQEAHERIQQFLDRFASRCAEAGVSCKVHEVIGEPWEQILLEAQRYDLIILGQQTYFHFETQQSPCETVQMVVRNSPRPVVTVPEKLGSGDAILIAYDGSLQAARAVQAFQQSGLYQGQQVYVVGVAKELAEASDRVQRAVEFLNYHAIKATPCPLSSLDPPGQVLLEQVRHYDAGLLVMGAYGQPVLREFFFGSVTKTMLREATIPLFVYH